MEDWQLLIIGGFIGFVPALLINYIISAYNNNKAIERLDKEIEHSKANLNKQLEHSSKMLDKQFKHASISLDKQLRHASKNQYLQLVYSDRKKVMRVLYHKIDNMKLLPQAEQILCYLREFECQVIPDEDRNYLISKMEELIKWMYCNDPSLTDLHEYDYEDIIPQPLNPMEEFDREYNEIIKETKTSLKARMGDIIIGK